jgi:hypothetical protein
VERLGRCLAGEFEARVTSGTTGDFVGAVQQASLERLEEGRRYECRLTPDRALETLDDAEAFLRDRGMLTLTPDCSLPSLFAACHDEPYKPGGHGFASWPKTKWWWGGALEERPGVHWLKVRRGRGLLVTDEVAALLDPLCRDELARAEAGELGDVAARLVEHLASAGPSLAEELREELGLDSRTLKAARERAERVGAVVARRVTLEEPHRHTSELQRWDQRFAEPAGRAGGLAELVVAGVRASVVAPEGEVLTWFTWRATAALIQDLVASGRLWRPEARYGKGFRASAGITWAVTQTGVIAYRRE